MIAEITETVPQGLEERPGHGPRIVFFSGGTALREVSRELVRFTHNALHLITPFDSGGSTAELRRHFSMPAVGDVRNRMTALADPERVPTGLVSLFAYRLDAGEPENVLRERLHGLCAGTDRLMLDLPVLVREVCARHFRYFAERMPDDFLLGGACLGNLLLTGGYLRAGNDLFPVLSLFSRLLRVRGQVAPIVTDDLHLAVELEDGVRLVGQHLFTGKGGPCINAPVRRMYLTDARPDDWHEGRWACSGKWRAGECRVVRPEVSEHLLERIRQADLICYPMGSFYSSVIAALLPRGVGRAISEADCPKIFVPNVGRDPEELGMGAQGRIRVLLDVLRADAGEVETHRLLTHVLLDEGQEVPSHRYPGLHVRRAPLLLPHSDGAHDAPHVARVLASLAWMG
ncbi:GAK system CofD-like protein [Desulfovibrio psychrotolerans]|uniref:GAK system CofD-like protein n=1 Tax=Desulfovibrio psychrotolerans TaxID=415242 RepID=A0A7J0BR83_9BACT|nr:GAK system CofD-like protein [Desulfovibrio psychrotolerans]GFM35721.1 hypothetical protein DSM19430T_04050 [Desulfovibrio psychrotolerans]